MEMVASIQSNEDSTSDARSKRFFFILCTISYRDLERFVKDETGSIKLHQIWHVFVAQMLLYKFLANWRESISIFFRFFFYWKIYNLANALRRAWVTPNRIKLIQFDCEKCVRTCNWIQFECDARSSTVTHGLSAYGRRKIFRFCRKGKKDTHKICCRERWCCNASSEMHVFRLFIH